MGSVDPKRARADALRKAAAEAQPAHATDREQRQAALVRALGQVVYDWRPKDDTLDWDGEFTTLLGYTADEMGRDTASWTTRVHPDDLPGVLAEVEKARVQNRPYDLEYRFRHRDGHYVWMHDRGVLFLDERGELERIVGVFRDVTDRKRADERIQRLSRIRALFGDLSALVIRARSRAELFQETCRVAVDRGGFALAWIGIIGDNAELIPVARHGDDGGYLSDQRFPLDGTDPDRCVLTERAARDGVPQVSNDVAADGRLGSWRERLQALRFGSYVSLPLAHGERVLGTLNLYARERGAFDDEELRVLAEMADNVAYALEFIVRDETLGYLSIYDKLTRLPNRALFLKRVAGFIDAQKDSGSGVALLMLDIERFKSINDAIGHAGGDEMLKLVADRLKAKAGGPSYVARLAGDRFGVVLPEVAPGADVEALVRAAGWARPLTTFRHAGTDFAVTFKTGFAVFPDGGGDAETLLRNAEVALKQGKTRGIPITAYTTAMGDAASRKLALDRQLRRALEREELELHYQAKVELRTGRIVGAEALLRCASPGGVPAMAGEMVAVMEETDLIVDFGRWALGRAMRDRHAWLAQGLAAPPIAVNVSPVQVRDSGFVKIVRDALASAAPGSLEIEVTESVMLADSAANAARLRAIREMGVTIALDDFGVGYSSLAYLGRLPLNSLKIDQSFVARMESDPSAMTVVGAIISLAHAMNLKAVAEGVETPGQLSFLRALRCDEIQGFIVGAAVPPAQFAALLQGGAAVTLP